MPLFIALHKPIKAEHNKSGSAANRLSHTMMITDLHRIDLQGGALFFQQTWAQLVKRSISAKRDYWALLNQLAVPILLVLVALLSGKSTSNFPQEPVLPINR